MTVGKKTEDCLMARRMTRGPGSSEDAHRPMYRRQDRRLHGVRPSRAAEHHTRSVAGEIARPWQRPWTALCLASRAIAARRFDIIGSEACKCRIWEGVSANQRGPTAMTCSRPGCRYRTSLSLFVGHLRVVNTACALHPTYSSLCSCDAVSLSTCPAF